MKSFYFYIHREISGLDGVWKVGKAMTPYSAVRARQKFMWNKFSLDYLYFGNPKHIDRLENKIKIMFYHYSAKFLQNGSAQTEILKIDISDLLATVNFLIKENNWQIKLIELKKPYSASNSGECPLNIPSEAYSHSFLARKAEAEFGPDPDTSNFYSLLEAYNL
jgi:hypothetical protein